MTGPLTTHERDYLAGQHLGRIATVSAKGVPDVAPVGFRILDGDVVEIGGIHNPGTLKWRNVEATGLASFVVDDLATVDPWRPRGVKVRGAATADVVDGRHVLRITPRTIWSWGVNPDAEKHFAGVVERREA